MPKPNQRAVIVRFDQDKIQEALDCLNKDKYRVSQTVVVAGNIQFAANPQFRTPESRGPDMVLLIADYIPPKPISG